MLFIHGFLDSHRAWTDILEALPSNRRIVAITLRGFGDSSKNGPFTIESYYDDVMKVLDVLDIPRAILVGHSMGTMISTYAAARCPDRVVGIVLCGGAAHANELKGAWPAIESFASGGPLTEEQKNELCEFQDGAPRDSRTMVETFKASTEAIYGSWCSLTEGDNHTAELAMITAPTLILWGTEDKIFEAPSQAVLKAALSAAESTFIEVPGATHDSLIAADHGRRCAAFIQAWCATSLGDCPL